MLRNNNTPQVEPKPSHVSAQGIGAAVGTMVVMQMLGIPVIHTSNVIAAAAAKQNLRTLQATRIVYVGLGNAPKNTGWNFLNGTAMHLRKEFFRALARAPALAYFNPYLQAQFTPALAATIFAATLSCYEMVINPFDARKAKEATGQPFKLFSSQAYAGAFGNGCRIFVSWYAFLKATQVLNPLLKQSDINPDSLAGMALKVPFQSLAWTSMSYSLESVVRRLQVSDETYKAKTLVEVGKSWGNYLKGKEGFPKSVYWQVGVDVVKKQGAIGLFYGFTAKLFTNGGLSFINNAVPVATKKVEELVSEWKSPSNKPFK